MESQQIALHGKIGNGKYAIVDADDHAYLSQWKWYLNTYGYAVTTQIKVDNKRVTTSMHSLLADTPKGFHTDHKNGDKLDNRKSNLRVCTAQENMRNIGSITNKHGYKGISKNGTGFMAQIGINGRAKYIGTFKTVLEAAQAYNDAAIEHFGEYANLNKLELSHGK